MGDKPPVFRVSFDSYDDFLVEYGDHLRNDVLVIPRGTGDLWRRRYGRSQSGRDGCKGVAVRRVNILHRAEERGIVL